MSKTTTLSAERDLPEALRGFKERATAVRSDHQSAKKQIREDARRSDVAKKEDLAALDKQTRSKLDGIKGEQDSYVKGLRDKIESELRGAQPSDANSVLIRRDAADRARKIADAREAKDVLSDAIYNGDDAMAHAVGARARSNAWLSVAEAYQAAYPSTADSAEALALVEGLSSDMAFNMSNQITYAAPSD